MSVKHCESNRWSTNLLLFLGPICREHILLPRGRSISHSDPVRSQINVLAFPGGVTSFPPSFIVNQLLDLVVRRRRDVIPKCSLHTNEELLFCETCDKIFCQLCDQHQISAEHTVVPFSLAIKRMNEILFFKATKSKAKRENSLRRSLTRSSDRGMPFLDSNRRRESLSFDACRWWMALSMGNQDLNNRSLSAN